MESTLHHLLATWMQFVLDWGYAGVFAIMTILGAGLFNGALAWFGIKVLGDQPALMKDPGAMIEVVKSKSHWLIGFAVVIATLYALMMWMQRRAKRRPA